ncbi:unnamed protein product [Linum trigynum]|uniref:Uncharacterized protein n=1 Tax=Linum trigynum TaxID=586398 RepID=A0AAV2CHG7_9ROSI
MVSSSGWQTADWLGVVLFEDLSSSSCHPGWWKPLPRSDGRWRCPRRVTAAHGVGCVAAAVFDHGGGDPEVGNGG